MQKVRRFPIGGTHLPENKDLTTDVPIRTIEDPAELVIPLKQHIGGPCQPLVAIGDTVKKNQLIAANDQGLSAAIHSGINGVVSAIEVRKQIDSSEVQCIILKREAAESKTAKSITPVKTDAAIPDKKTVVHKVKEAGIVGMGGAAFPTHVKLDIPEGTLIDTIIINGAECEPYITTDDRLMQEMTAELFRGLEIIRVTTGAKEGYVACEINKPQAIIEIEKEAEKWPQLHSVKLDTRYPHGAEKHLIKAVLNREVPIRKLPMVVGVVVNNVQTAIAIARAVDQDLPLTHRVLTVSGSAIKEPANLNVPLGTQLKDLIAEAGGFSSENHRIIVGGPMTGIVTEDMTLPVTKATSGVVVIKAEEYADRRSEVCIRCGQCVSVCPMYLQPNRITAFVHNEMLAEAEEFGLLDCILCGACSFVCPSRRPLLQWLREGKGQSANKNA